MSLEHCSDATPVNVKVAVHVKVRNSTKFLNKNEERRNTFVSIAIHLIKLDNNHQFTKLAK